MDNQEVRLTLEQVNRYEVCKRLLDGDITNKEAAKGLRLSVRQVQRIKRRIEQQGAKGVIHGNTGREPPNKTPQPVRDRVLKLAEKEYADYNFSHLADTLAEEHNIVLSDETLRLWLRPQGHGRPVRRRGKHRRRRKRKAREGQMLFLDGSPHQWFGPEKPPCCLILASDDATGKPLWGKFQAEEDRDGCFEVCYHLFSRFGLPASFYLDRASQFITTRHGGLHVKQGPDTQKTHFEIAMDRLAIGLSFANSPQARGRGERLNGTFQDRLVAELAHKGITECREATKYLNKQFIPKYCRWFGKEPREPEPLWRPVPAGLELKTVLCAKYTRTVANDNTVSFQGTTYQLYPPNSCYHLVRAKLEVQQWFNGSVHFYHQHYGQISSRALPRDEESTQ